MTQHEWEGDLPTEHLNRCELRDKLLYADILNDDGSHRVAWRCHKREGHDGPCSTHNDCGVMNGGVVCGMKPGHQGPHSWETRIHLSASRTPNEPTPALSQVVVDVIRRMRKFAATSDDSYAMETWADELEQALALSSVRTPETTPDQEPVDRTSKYSDLLAYETAQSNAKTNTICQPPSAEPKE